MAGKVLKERGERRERGNRARKSKEEKVSESGAKNIHEQQTERAVRGYVCVWERGGIGL